MLRRHTDMPPDDSALDAFLGILSAALSGLALLVLCLGLTWCSHSAHAQTLLSMDRADYTRGPERIECWLVPAPRAAQYVTGTLVVDCGSDVDGLFRNGFEVLP